MRIQAVYLDFGGVIFCTVDREPRRRLAEHFHMSYREMEKFVFESESSRRASVGEITEENHWLNVLDALKVDHGQKDDFVNRFFGGDELNQSLLGFMKRLRPDVRIGLISNAWSGLRAWLTGQGIADQFDQMIISAEVGVMKPDQRIYHLALDEAGITPAETVFMDDMPANVDAAKALGMHGIHFRQAEPAIAELKRILNSSK